MSTKPSALYSKARTDTRTAWSASRLERLFKAEKIAELGVSLREANASQLAELFMRMSYAPYSGAATSGLDDGKAAKLSQYLLAAIFGPFVSKRARGQSVDLEAVQERIVQWIDSGSMGPEFDQSAPDLTAITALIGAVEARITLCAPFAAPIEFAILALSGASAVGGMEEKLECSDV